MSFADSNFGKTWGMRAIFLLKMLKIWSRFKKLSKKLREFFVFLETYLWIGCGKSSLLQTVYLLLAVHVLTVSPKIWHIIERHIPTQYLPNWLEDMMKVLSCRFQQCLGCFNILTVEGCSETGDFRHLTNHVF